MPIYQRTGLRIAAAVSITDLIYTLRRSAQKTAEQPSHLHSYSGRRYKELNAIRSRMRSFSEEAKPNSFSILPQAAIAFNAVAVSARGSH